jgi:DNA (cytosine-5)-methyltransferase 1
MGMGSMNYLSVCSGIEAATVAWHDMGWKPIGFSEIEKFPSQLLQHHYPHVTNYGDMTKFKEWNLNDSIGLLVGGTPCQSFSVAGLRKGLEDPRGNLALIYCGILDRFRPQWFVWENVPGVLSSGGGRDFGSFLGAVAELGYGFAYRVLDAQYFGVAQRRRRVFVVGYLGDWRPAAKVLFEPESLRRDTPPSRSKREEATSRSGIGPEISGPLAARRFAETDGLSTTSAQMIAVPPVANCLQTSCNDYSRADGFNMIALAENTIGRQPHNGGNGDGFTEGGPMYTLNATGVHGIAQPIKFGKHQQDVIHVDAGIMSTLPAGTHGNAGHFTKTLFNMRVRRLTPMECERLQGFPDNYTKTPTSSDTTRYKALGNSMAVPVMKWIGQRINEL